MMQGDPLLSEEEVRPKQIEIAKSIEQDKPSTWVKNAAYMMELEFHKIKRVSYQFEEQTDELQILIEMTHPATARKCVGKNNTSHVRSPLNMSSQNQFLNYWNVN